MAKQRLTKSRDKIKEFVLVPAIKYEQLLHQVSVESQLPEDNSSATKAVLTSGGDIDSPTKILAAQSSDVKNGYPGLSSGDITTPVSGEPTTVSETPLASDRSSKSTDRQTLPKVKKDIASSVINGRKRKGGLPLSERRKRLRTEWISL